MGRKAGREAKLYRQTTGAREAWPASGAPSNLEEMTTVRDISLAMDRAEADASVRGCSYEEVVAGLIKAPLEWDMPYDPDDTDLTALETAFHAGTMVPLAFANGDATTVGTIVFWADWIILKFDQTATLDGNWLVSIQAKPHAQSAVEPELATVGS